MKSCAQRLTIGGLLLTGLCIGSTGAVETNATYSEPYRPQFHFTPPENWMNDPNGLVYHEGTYHLYYQYTYDSRNDQTGNKHWGHAASTDLVHWAHRPIAIFPDDLGTIYSGSAVVDHRNTSGLGSNSIVAIYTSSDIAGPGGLPPGGQKQSIAYSTNGGLSFVKYGGNPVLPAIGGAFRDPKVIWHEPTSNWVMSVVGNGASVLFYTSPNLTNWTAAGSFGGEGFTAAQWEVPDLFELSVDGQATNTRWMLLVSMLPHPATVNGGSAMQYFIGSFDGTNFVNDNPPSTVLWFDHGKDNYAGITYSDIPTNDGRRIYLGWMNNWVYAEVLPTTPWRGALTLPRTIALRTFPEGIRAVQQPVAELQRLRTSTNHWEGVPVAPGSNLLASVTGQTVEIVAAFDTASATADEFGFRVLQGGADRTLVAYDAASSNLFVDRSGFDAGRRSAALAPDSNGMVRLHLFVDGSSVEVFGNERIALSESSFPATIGDGLELYSVGGTVTVSSLDIYPLASIWPHLPSNEFDSVLTGFEEVNGTWDVFTNGLQGAAFGFNDSFAVANESGSNFTFEADMTLRTRAGGLLFRSQGGGTGYVANIDSAENVSKLFRPGGLIASAPLAVDVDKTYRMKIVTAGENIKVYIDDDLLIDANDATFSGGRFGFNVFDGVSMFDHVRVRDLSVKTRPATQVGYQSVRLNGEVIFGLAPQPDVAVYWGPVDGGTNAAAWSNRVSLGKPPSGPVAYDLTNLLEGTEVFFRYFASNETEAVWAADTESATTLLDYTAWAGRARIVFVGYTESGTLTNFPVLVTLREGLGGFHYGDTASPQGYDLRFSSDGADVLAYEIESWDTNGPSQIWVRVPELVDDRSAVLVYWGNPAATNLPSYATNGAVWDAAFEAVWHLRDADPLDATANEHTGSGTGNTSAPGVIGDGQDFDGTSAYIDTGNWDVFGNQITLSAWIRPDSGVDQVIIGKSHADTHTNPYYEWLLYKGANNVLHFRVDSTTLDSPNDQIVDGAWLHVAGVYDGSQMRIYVNGILAGNTGKTGSLQTGDRHVRIGGRDTPVTGLAEFFDGVVDEVRISRAARATRWLRASYLNQEPDSTFLLFESAPAPLIIGDVHDTPAPSWSDSYGADIVLPEGGTTPAALTIETAVGDLLLAFEAGTGFANPAALAESQAVRVVVNAGDSGLGLALPFSEIAFMADGGKAVTIYLPAISLGPGETTIFWVATDGSTYFGEIGQGAPDFSAPAREALVLDLMAVDPGGEITWRSVYTTGVFHIESASTLFGPWRTNNPILVTESSNATMAATVSTTNGNEFYRMRWMGDPP